MNEFQYNSPPQEQARSDMLKSQSHRLARQQVIFALIFLLVIVLAAYYIITRMIWVIYDGYITIDENPISAVDDIYILKVNKEIGEVVHKGDTLYSYVLLGNIVNQYDPNILPSAVKETHDMEVQAQLAKEEIPEKAEGFREFGYLLRTHRQHQAQCPGCRDCRSGRRTQKAGKQGGNLRTG